MRVLRRALFEVLAPHAPEIVPGECRFADGTVLKDSVTIHCPRSMEVVLRGGHSTKHAYGVCKVCQMKHSTRAMLKRPWHVIRSSIPAGDAFLAPLSSLLLSDELAARLDLSPFPDLVLKPILVMDEPIERVPEFGE